MKNFILGIVISIFSITIGCSSTSSTLFPPINIERPAEFTTGTTKIESTKTIGNSGGTLSITEGPLKGTVVKFPSGALPASNTIEIGYNDGKLTNIGDSTYSGNAFIINVSNNKNFDKPISITMPLPDGDIVPVTFYVDEKGVLNFCQIVDIDRINKTYTFETFHASTYVTVLANNNSQVISTSFLPENDGFQIDNFGSSYNTGECVGMTTFSVWFFKNKKSTEGNFYPKFMGVIGKDREGNNLTGQDIIATRAFIAINQIWSTYYGPIINRSQSLTPADNFSMIKTALNLTKCPVLLGIYPAINTIGHSIAVYKLDGTTFSVYDPNYHGETKQLKYNNSTKQFEQYDNRYSVISYMATGGELLTAESFDFIYQDAKANFDQETKAKIAFSSHEEGGTITTLATTLIGNIQSSEIKVTEIEVYTDKGAGPFIAQVNDGDFSLPLTLDRGLNLLYFKTFGKDANGNKIEIANNWGSTPFSIKVDVPQTKVLVTLTWNTPESDLDLYVVDPNNDYSCYFHEKTDDGGFLDFDDTDGYGPEHWTLMTNNTIQYNRPYKIRVHYYRENQSQPATNYKVVVKTDEGTSNEKTITYTGTLSYASSSNDQYNNTGSDWADVATITLAGGSNISTRSLRQNVVVPPLAIRHNLKKK